MKMDLPSGRSYFKGDVTLLLKMAEYGFIQRSDEPKKLNSGILSYVYVFGRNDMTEHPDLEWLVGEKSALLVQAHSEPDDGQPCLIGLPTAGTAFAQAASMVSYRDNILVNSMPICHRTMRQVLKKSHGTHPEWVDGDPVSKHTYWTVDNVVTNADSKFTANQRFLENGYPVYDMPSFIWIDRQQGGVARMEKAGFKRIVVAYNLLDITFAFGEMRVWPKETVKMVSDEIAAHQFN